MLTAAEELPADPVRLRRWRESDADALLSAVCDSIRHLAPWMPWAAQGYTRADAETFLAEAADAWGTSYDYAIVAPPRAIAGSCSLMARIGHGGFEIGYWVHAAHLRRGYASAAAATLAAEAFRIGADRVEIVHDVANVASGAIPHRLGFTEVARRRPQEEGTTGEAGLDVVWRLAPPVMTGKPHSGQYRS